jgi:hypothetical protein
MHTMIKALGNKGIHGLEGIWTVSHQIEDYDLTIRNTFREIQKINIKHLFVGAVFLLWT